MVYFKSPFLEVSVFMGIFPVSDIAAQIIRRDLSTDFQQSMSDTNSRIDMAVGGVFSSKGGTLVIGREAPIEFQGNIPSKGT